MMLNQYYTENKYGDFLVQNLSIASPQVALDIGFGAGDLLHAAKRRWEEISLVGIDIDKSNVHQAKSSRLIKALELSGFEPSLPKIINDRFGAIDLLISNPPFFSCDLDFKNKEILKAIGMMECLSNKLKKVPAELIFLAQNLRLLTKFGEIGIIVPAGLISGQKWKPIREFLLCNYQITNVIQLPTNSFKKTDAQTFIMTLKHKMSSNENVPLSHISQKSIIGVDLINARERVDYSYYQEISTLTTTKKLFESDFTIYRGNKSHKELSILAPGHIHTTNMPNISTEKDIGFYPFEKTQNVQAGDILIARVGRRCLGRVMRVQKGRAPISDCIIAITPKNKSIGQKIWKKLSSQKCRHYLFNASLGVGAKYITYKIITDYLTNKHETSK
jgi:type I restriction-modification system DNA methylase subunit